MTTERIRVTGLEEVRRALRAVPDKLARRALRKAVRAGAAVVVQAAKAKAPVRTGALKRAIEQRPGRTSFSGPELRGNNGVRRIVGVAHGRVQESRIRGERYLTGKGRTKRLTARQRRREDPWYFRFQEQGWIATGRRGRAARGQGRRVKGTPFLRPALKQTAQQVIAVQRDVLRRELLDAIS